MLFSSNIFLYIFLPSALLLYFSATKLCNNKIVVGNTILLAFSLLFYLWGSGKYFLLLVISIVGNYAFGWLIEYSKQKKLILILAIIYNIGLLIYYKYFNFIYENVDRLAGYSLAPIENIFLPIGISFYSFQALSYVIDVYKGDVKVQRSLPRFAMYISFFPQLIAGPIVRYKNVETEIDKRESTLDDIYQGACRFCFGLAKKVLLADTFGLVADKIFALQFSSMSTPLAWTGIILYTFQIYMDFSAYSDMAIGMARIFGFHFLENFILPYTSKNITEFWRRWHLSLSTFFRDYLYIPLGGSRKGVIKTYRNLTIVFLLCGLWHGASWIFVLWGIYHGVLLVIERILLHKFSFKMRGAWGNIITMLLIMFGWLIFRSPNVGFAIQYARVLLGGQRLEGFQYYTYWFYVNAQTITFALFAAAISVIPFTKIREKYRGSHVHGIVAIVLLVLSMFYMSDASFSPFIYFQF